MTLGSNARTANIFVEWTGCNVGSSREFEVDEVDKTSNFWFCHSIHN